jgi:hypothetical protein
MSTNGSDSSTPRGTPPPDTSGPSPLTVGTHFVKQYYHVLSTSPDKLHRFYQPSSILSTATGSKPTQSTPFEASLAQPTRWTSVAGPMRFAFEHGAIDAQAAASGGLLLTVTGHMQQKHFVHTFFLSKKDARYYVQNDILRFLTTTAAVEKAEEEVATSETEETSAPGGGVEETKEEMRKK